MDDQVRVVTGPSREVDELGEDLGLRAVDGLDRRLVAQPGQLHLAEAHGFDQARIVGREIAADLEPGLLRHVREERVPVLPQGRRRVGAEDAEGDLLGPERGGGDQGQEQAESGLSWGGGEAFGGFEEFLHGGAVETAQQGALRPSAGPSWTTSPPRRATTRRQKRRA